MYWCQFRFPEARRLQKSLWVERKRIAQRRSTNGRRERPCHPRASIVNSPRRFSASEITRRSSKSNVIERCEEGQARKNPASPQTNTGNHASAETLFLGLPAELLTQILQRLAFMDPCNLRLVSKTLHQQASEGDILRAWIKKRLNPHLLRLHPAPDGAISPYLASQHRRHRRAKHTAVPFTRYIESEIIWLLQPKCTISS